MTVLYNEIDSHAAEWLRNLIRDGEIAPGDVDERSIVDLRPSDLRGYRQVHLFAGVGVWSYSLRRIGWSDDRQIWTGSCPCPPFSAAGKAKACPSCGGTNPIPHVGRTGCFVCCICDHEWLADGRHLWPEMWRLVRDCRPPIVLGEQVASADGRVWLSSVRASLEILGYVPGGIDTCSAGHGAPHIRQRIRFATFDRRSNELGVALGSRLEGLARHGDDRNQPGWFGAVEARSIAAPSAVVGMADANGRDASAERQQLRGQQRLQPEDGRSGDVADSNRDRRDARIAGDRRGEEGAGRKNRDVDDRCRAHGVVADAIGRQLPESERGSQERDGDGSNRPDDSAIPGIGHNHRPGPVNGFWRDSDWLYCRDGKWRPVEPGTFPLVDGASFRVGSGGPFEGKSRTGMLRGYGNAVDAEATAAFCEAVLGDLIGTEY